ncbi:acyl-CoA dehydratase activase [Deltaproteobacteria bacterium TL4]
MSGYYGGCDVGSTTGKAVIIKEGKIVGSALIPSRIDPVETATKVLEEACRPIEDLDGYRNLKFLVGTGYGRTEIPFAGENVSEITCHAVGAHHCNPTIRTIIDIGGQDVKAISVNENGTVRDFAMNDKCAAGTGRFFEAMARIFQMSLEELAALSLNSKKTVSITSQCSVFAETEVISLLNSRVPPADIAAGINTSICKRVFGMAKRAGIEPNVTVTGGCAKNKGLLQSLHQYLRVEIEPLNEDPQLMGALGAAVLASRKN